MKNKIVIQPKYKPGERVYYCSFADGKIVIKSFKISRIIIDTDLNYDFPFTVYYTETSRGKYFNGIWIGDGNPQTPPLMHERALFKNRKDALAASKKAGFVIGKNRKVHS